MKINCENYYTVFIILFGLFTTLIHNPFLSTKIKICSEFEQDNLTVLREQIYEFLCLSASHMKNNENFGYRLKNISQCISLFRRVR